MTAYNKLVRDKIPQILDARGIPYELRIADDAEYRAELIRKLGEEAAEFLENPSPEELSDIKEVVTALERLQEFANTEGVRIKKREERGGFDKRVILKGEKG